ncbi:hypothetical protein GCM10028818_33820 [Spirosoma horti]
MYSRQTGREFRYKFGQFSQLPVHTGFRRYDYPQLCPSVWPEQRANGWAFYRWMIDGQLAGTMKTVDG